MRESRFKVTPWVGLILLVASLAVLNTPALTNTSPQTTSFSLQTSIQTASFLLQANWEPAFATPKMGGYGEAVLSTGDSLYIVRAWSTGRWYFWKYSLDNSELIDLTSPPERPKNGTALAWDGGEYIYVLLGAANGDEARSFFYRYHIPTDTWTQLSDTPGPQGAGDSLTWCGLDGKLYALTGSRKRPCMFVSYDPQTNVWEKLPFNPKWPRVDDGAALVWTGGEWLYALAGEWEEEVPHRDFARYHIPTQTWEQLPDIPDPGGVGDGASLLWVGNWVPSLQNYIFALGGNSVREEPGYGFFVFDLATQTWTILPDLPCPVGTYVGNRLAYVGGAIWYWTGTSSKWPCGGSTMFRMTLP